MADTLFFEIKLKRNKTPIEVYKKLEKKINKKTGPTCKWECIYNADAESILIDFHDNKSETFILKLDKKETYSGFCKVYFDLGDDIFDKSSEYKALLDIFYSIKSFFSVIAFSDDYGLAKGYWDSKRFQFEYRELTADEYKRVEKFYAEGYTKHEELLRAIMAEDMEMTYQEFINYENPSIAIGRNKGKIQNTLLTYLYETSEFQKEGRVCEFPDYVFEDTGKHTFAMWAFMEGIAWIFCDGSGYGDEITLETHRCMIPKLSQIDLIYQEKFAPLFMKETDAFQRCVLAYRYFMSVYEYTGFLFAGRIKNVRLMIDEVLEEFGRENGEIYLTCYITSERYIFHHSKGEEYGKNFTRNVTKRYGENFLEHYESEFKIKYQENYKFQQETKYYAETKLKYVDDSLVCKQYPFVS